MLLKTLKTCLFFCVMVSANAQNFVDATIFKPNGDSISGQINYQEWYVNPAFITFRAAKSAKTQEFRPKDLSKFVIKSKNEVYESAVVVVLDQTLRDLEAKDASATLKDALQSLKFRSDTAFLLVLEKGRAGLYSYVDKNTMEHYFVRKGKGMYGELMNPKFKIKEGERRFVEQNKMSYINVEDYKTRLSELTVDCPKLKQEINNLGYSPGYFRSLINKYNDCVGENEYSKKISKIKIKYFATIGLSLPVAKVNGLFYNEESTIVGKLTPLIGGGFETVWGRELNPLRIGAEINLVSNKYQGEVSGNNRTISYNAKLVGINLFPFFKLNLYNNSQKEQTFFVKLGTILTYYPTRFCEKKYVVPAGLFGDQSFTLSKTAFSIVISGGYQFKHLYIEGQFLPYSGDVILYNEDTFRAIGGTLKVGYVF